MEIPVEHLQKIKTALHIAQAVFIFPAWCLVIAVFRTDAIFRGPLNWYFAVCFLSIPAIIYNSMTLAFPRSRKWANAYAFCAIDVVFAILWLSAFAAVAAWNTSGSCVSGCSLSKALVGLGFFVFIFFGFTSAISVYGAEYYRRNGVIPGVPRATNNVSMIDPDVEAFSTEPHDEYAPVLLNDKDDGHDAHEADGSHRYDDTSYGGASVASGAGSAYHPAYVSESGSHSGYQEPSTYSEPAAYNEPAGYHDPIGYQEPVPDRVQFPAGNYHK